jgi:hypothetical protein
LLRPINRAEAHSTLHRGMAMQIHEHCSKRGSDQGAVSMPCRRSLGALLVAFASALFWPLAALAQPMPLDNVSTLAAGAGHSCAALGRGGVRCWCQNALAQLGDGRPTYVRQAARPCR